MHDLGDHVLAAYDPKLSNDAAVRVDGRPMASLHRITPSHL